MPIDYSIADQVVELSFQKLNKPSAKMDFPKPGTLSDQFSLLIKNSATTPHTLPHQQSQMLASASVEMWHRAIHSFLWSLALTKSSNLWASVSGYYASHYVMRAFAYSMGIYKSFLLRKAIQIIVTRGQFVCSTLDLKGGEHAFYWKAIKGHPKLLANPLFHENNERDKDSDSAHRTFANYTDHLDSFSQLESPSMKDVTAAVEKISRIRKYSVTEPSREDYPDLQNVQILAFQRIIAFNDFLDEKISTNRFWKAHRRPGWCRDMMVYQVMDNGLEQPSIS